MFCDFFSSSFYELRKENQLIFFPRRLYYHFFFLNKRLTAWRTFEEPLIYYKHAWISLDSKEYAKCAILSPECFCTWLNVISPAPWSENSCVRRSAAAGGCEGNYSLILLS